MQAEQYIQFILKDTPTDTKTLDQPKTSLEFPVAGIGASAGGLVALERLLTHLPADSGIAFVIVLHLSPKHKSHIDNILQRHTRMPVLQVQRDTPIEANHVYVISPRFDMTIVGGLLKVTPIDRGRGPNTSIDVFFRALALEHRARAMCVVMSGTGADGSVGLARIKEQGGITVVQDPADCEFEDMPRNAILTGKVDFVRPAAEIPQLLLDIWNNAQGMALPPSPVEEELSFVEPDQRPETEQALRDIIQLLALRSGHDFSHYKRATVLRRMERRLQVRMLKDLPAYRDYLRDHPDETQALLDDMLIGVTNFFRDRESFEALEREVIPALAGDCKPDNQIRVWVPGCASGEEAYSIAMLLREETDRLAPAPPYQIFATDIDESALAFARKGSYPESIVVDVPPARLREFFRHEQQRHIISKSIRDRIVFAAQNILRDPPFSHLDLISCRNLLIYLNRDIQEKVLEMFYFSLRPGGFLFLGGSESPDALRTLFEVVDKKHRIYRAASTNSGQRRTPFFPLRLDTNSAPAAKSPETEKTRPNFSFADMHQRVLEHYAPPSVIVDQLGNIAHMSPRAGEFLRHPAGVPSYNLLSIVHPALRAELRSAVMQAVQSGQSVEARRVRMPRGDDEININMFARPFRDDESGSDFVLVLFEESQSASDDTFAQVTNSTEQALVQQLERELRTARTQLVSTLESSDTSTEELKASNEELQAANEELRSTTEELETSKEELQSVNEELSTVNGELRIRIEEVARTNDDLNNFIAATDIATIFVDGNLRIKRYTPQMETIFNIIASDVGRNVFDLTHRLFYPTFATDIAAVVKTLRPLEREVRGGDGRQRFMVRMRSYVSSKRQVEGALITFIDVTSLRAAQAVATRAEADMRMVLESSLDFAVISLDRDGMIIGWNHGAHAVFGYTQTDIAGRRVHELFTPEDRAAKQPEREMEIARERGRAPDERWHLHQDGRRIFCSGVLTPVDIGGHLEGYVKIVRDVTQQREMQQSNLRLLFKAQAESADALAASAMKDEFLAVMSHELKHPLNLININAEIIGRALDPELKRAPAAARALTTISRAVRTQSRIVDDLLDLSRLRTGKLTLDLTAVDLVAVVRSTIEPARADPAAAELHIEFESNEKPITLHADSARLHQIVWNLLHNAIKFTPPGGRIHVRVDSEDGFGRLDVSDTGQGIAQDVLPDIFEMFGQGDLRASSEQHGLGIGLAIVRQLVEHHNGRVEASSQGLGTGARFTVWLPLYDPQTQSILENNHPAVRSTLPKGLRVLIVDDDRLTVDALRILLEMEGADVMSAVSGDEALRQFAEHPIDVVLTDLGMPEMDGYALLAALRALPNGAKVPIIALSGFGRDKDLKRADKAGFTAHIAKPVSIDALLSTIVEARQNMADQ